MFSVFGRDSYEEHSLYRSALEQTLPIEGKRITESAESAYWIHGGRFAGRYLLCGDHSRGWPQTTQLALLLAALGYVSHIAAVATTTYSIDLI